MNPSKWWLTGLLTASILATLPGDGGADWPTTGVPVCLAPGMQRINNAVSDGAGGIIVVWEDFRATPAVGVYAQRIMADGSVAPGWPVDGLAIISGPGWNQGADIVSDGAGGAIIAWMDTRSRGGGSWDVWAQRITADGTIAAGWSAGGVPVCLAPDKQHWIQVVQDGAGGAFVSWLDQRTGASGDDIYLQHISSDGLVAPGWPATGVPVSAEPSWEERQLMLEDGSGGVFVSWERDSRLRLQRIGPSGQPTPGWPIGGIELADSVLSPPRRLVPDGTGGVIVFWTAGWNTGSEGDVYGLRVLGSGVVAPGWLAGGVRLCAALHDQYVTDAVADGSGGAFVTWDESHSSATVSVQRVTGSGEIAAGWPINGSMVAVSPYADNQRLTRGMDGGAIVSWWADYAIHSQLVAGDTGAGLWGPFGLPVTTGRRAGYRSSVGDHSEVSDGIGGAIIVWADTTKRELEPAPDLYAARVPFGPVPTLISLRSAVPGTDHVVLIWYGTEAVRLSGRVERRTESSGWQTLGTVSSDGDGHMRYVDWTVTPGVRYCYRLAYWSDLDERFTAEEWVTVPQPVLALHGSQPNPSSGDLVVRFSLPSAEPTRLAAYDLAGREVLAREVGPFGAGTHSLNITSGSRLPPGVYHVALIRGSHRDVKRVIVAR